MIDILDEEIRELWRLLNQHKVRYIVVGGLAVFLYGFHRATGDIDIWIDDTKENRRKLGRALQAFGYDELSFEEIQFVPGWSRFYIGSGMELDILIEMKGLIGFSFQECLDLVFKVDYDGNLVPILHINHLIANKREVNRGKDQIDVLELEKIKRIKNIE